MGAAGTSGHSGAREESTPFLIISIFIELFIAYMLIFSGIILIGSNLVWCQAEQRFDTRATTWALWDLGH